jgi:hypothetical protein
MRKVAPGDDRLCWQNVAFAKLDNRYKFDLPKISHSEWIEKCQ